MANVLCLLTCGPVPRAFYRCKHCSSSAPPFFLLVFLFALAPRIYRLGDASALAFLHCRIAQNDGAVPPPFRNLRFEKLAAEIRAETRKKIAALKKRGTSVDQAIKRAMWQAQQKEAARKKKADNHAKILLDVVAIDLAQHDAELKARIETHARHFYAQSPGRLDAALHGLDLAVTKPASETYEENV